VTEVSTGAPEEFKRYQDPAPMAVVVGEAQVRYLRPVDVTPHPTTEPRPSSVERPSGRTRSYLGLEVAVAFLVAFAVSFVVETPAYLALGVLGVWAPVAYRSGSLLGVPGARPGHGLLQASSPPLAVAGLTAAVVGLDPQVVVGALVLVAVASMIALVFRIARARRTRTVRVVVVGDRHTIEHAISRWPGTASVEVVGGCLMVPDPDLGIPPSDLLGVPVVIGPPDLPALVADTGAALVLVAPGRTVTNHAVAQIAWQLEQRQVPLALLGPLDLVAAHRVSPGTLGGTTLMHVDSSVRPALIRSVKGALDRASGLVLLALFAPLLVALAAVIRIDSRGPAIFQQTRVGRDGREFTMNKLRTMCQDAEQQKPALDESNEVDGALFKIKRDPRITRVGHFLRRSSLDELPQLINVVKGEMSLIGPRPSLPQEVATYDAMARRRLAVKPGITGLWQVSGRSDLPWDEAMRLDLHYTDNWRLSDDVLIALRTVRAVASSKGAY